MDLEAHNYRSFQVTNLHITIPVVPVSLLSAAAGEATVELRPQVLLHLIERIFLIFSLLKVHIPKCGPSNRRAAA